LRTISPWLDTSPLALVSLAAGVRPLLEGVARPILDEVAGMAGGAGLPFDAVWLVQSATVLSAQPNADAFYRAPFCTMFASTGDRAGIDELLVGRNLDWSGDDKPVILDITCDTGHRFVQIGFPWNVGCFTGMNDAGVVLCTERVAARGAPPIDGAPVEILLRQLLQTADDAEQALAQLQAETRLRGCHVLVAGPGKIEARVIEFGPAITIREPVNGFLMGVDPASPGIDDDTRARYTRVQDLLAGEHIIASGRMKDALADAQAGQENRSAIWNKYTKHNVVFEPRAGQLLAAFPDESGKPGEYAAISLKGEQK